MGLRQARQVVAVVLLAGLTACVSGYSYVDPQGVQIPLGGDRVCSDPVYDQMAPQCCSEHDNAFWVGGTEQDFHLANAEFLACMLLWDVPPEIAYRRWRAVDTLGWSVWTLRAERTRGPPR